MNLITILGLVITALEKASGLVDRLKGWTDSLKRKRDGMVSKQAAVDHDEGD